MTSLEFCHEVEFSKLIFIERKIRISNPKTILQGAPKSGKSYLIYDYLSNFENGDFLYIDFEDLRNDKEEIVKYLDEYISENKIKVLVLENYEYDFILPSCNSIIITTKDTRELKGYEKLFLNPLDFEEYLLHEKKNQNITHNFNNFLKYGNLPKTVNENGYNSIKELQNILKLINPNITSQEILNILILSMDEKKSLNQLFLALKSKIKISKDKFYEECKRFEEERIIYFLGKYNQEKAVKKIYCYNSAFFNAINHKKKFKNELTNTIFLELINKYKNIFYLDYIDFYIPSQNLAIVSIPFFNSILMKNQLKKIKKQLEDFQIKELNIVTVSNSEDLIHKDCKIYVTPFYEWALS